MYTSNPGQIDFGFKNQPQQPMNYGYGYQNNGENPNYNRAYQLLPRVIDGLVNNGNINLVDKNNLLNLLQQQQQATILNNSLNMKYPTITDDNNLDYFLTDYAIRLINSMRPRQYQPMYGQPQQFGGQPMYGQPPMQQMYAMNSYGQPIGVNPYMRPQQPMYGQPQQFGGQPMNQYGQPMPPQQQFMQPGRTDFMSQMNNAANGGLNNIQRAPTVPQQTAPQPAFAQVRPAPQPIKLETEYPEEATISYEPIEISDGEEFVTEMELATSPLSEDITIAKVELPVEEQMDESDYAEYLRTLDADVVELSVAEPIIIDAPYSEGARVLNECANKIKEEHSLTTDAVIAINNVLKANGTLGAELGKIITEEFNNVVELNTEMTEESTGKVISIPKVEEIDDISDLLLNKVPDSYKRITSNPKYATALGDAVKLAYGTIFNTKSRACANTKDMNIRNIFMDKFSNKFVFDEFDRAKGLAVYAHKNAENSDRIETLVTQKFKAITPIFLRRNYILHNFDVDDVAKNKYKLPKCIQTDILKHVLRKDKIHGIVNTVGQSVKRNIGISMDGSVITAKNY